MLLELHETTIALSAQPEIPKWWGYLSQGLMALALYTVGRYRKVGWSIGSLVQVLWIGLGMVTGYWSFVLPSVVTLLIYRHHMRTFRDEPFWSKMLSTRELQRMGGCRYCGSIPTSAPRGAAEELPVYTVPLTGHLRRRRGAHRPPSRLERWHVRRPARCTTIHVYDIVAVDK